MKQLEANFVVIGGGGAGIAAALTATELGITNIIVLEKRLNIGGNSSMAGGMLFGVESHFQKEAHDSTTRDDVFRETYAFHHFDRVNPRILRAFINGTAGTIQWLEDHGVAYAYRNGHVMKNVNTPFGGFGRAMKTLAEKFKDQGGQIILNTGVQQIMRAPDGKINGIVAKNKSGDEIKIKTGSVMLATGGFTGNKGLLHDYFPYYYDDNYWTDAVANMGDGIKLAGDAGAYLEDYCTIIRENGYCFDKSGKMPNRIHMSQGAVWVNKTGLRYIDETTGHNNASTNALLAQPEKIGFALFDDKLIQAIIDTPNPMATSREKEQTLREILADEAKEGEWCCISNSWTDIANWIGADPVVFKTTIDEYNGYCDKGRDDLFAKDKQALKALRQQPYYAVKFRPLMVDTAGPVRVNENMQVLDKQGKPIPGFFAGGVITSGWQGYDYHLFGSALCYTLTSGRIAGESIAKYLKGK